MSGKGASSDISLDLTLGGNIEANQCNTVLLGPVIVGGNVDIQNCTGAESGYETAQIGGNFTCDDNSRCLAAFGQVRGNMQINDNAEADVGNNTVGGNLRCQRNAAVFGSGNTVGGHKQGQCAGL